MEVHLVRMKHPSSEAPDSVNYTGLEVFVVFHLAFKYG